MRSYSTPALLVGGALIASLALAGCSSSVAAVSDSSNGGPIRVVASTNVYGDIASQIGGKRVKVTSIINDPSQDPHSYEADAQVQLSLSQADLVIQNGGGYDDFVSTLLKGASNSRAVVLTAAAISGYDQKPSTGTFNEHVWYDFPTVQKLVDRLVAKFSTLDSADAPTFVANAKRFTAGLTALEGREASIKSKFDGRGIAITEPVPLYMTTACGLVDKTPLKFSEAIEGGTDVSPIVLKETLSLFSERAVKLLAYNEQTSGPVTERVLAAAKSAGIAVVPVTETLPSGKDYLGWMNDNLAALTAALS